MLAYTCLCSRFIISQYSLWHLVIVGKCCWSASYFILKCIAGIRDLACRMEWFACWNGAIRSGNVRQRASEPGFHRVPVGSNITAHAGTRPLPVSRLFGRSARCGSIFPKCTSGWQPVGALGTSVAAIRGLDIPALLVLVAVLHVAEALLVRWQGGKLPLHCLSRANGGDWLAAIGWKISTIPLLLLVPTQGGFMLPWTPLFGGDAGTGYMLAALPVLMGFSSVTLVPATTTEGGTHFEPLAPIQCGFTSVELAGGMVESADIVSSVILFSGS